MADTALQDVHRLQCIDSGIANTLLLRFLREELDLPFSVEKVELRPTAISLNSINGVLETSAGRKFFKTHLEPGSIIGEYYNVKVLKDAGYPVIAPVFASTAYGKQFLVYDWFEAPSLFESIRAVETGPRGERELLEAAQASDDLVFNLYADSLCVTDADAHARQPIHQLFLHRLAGGRYRRFYDGDFVLPGHRFPFAELATKTWIINGVMYRDTLESIVARAIAMLRFSGTPHIASIIGHGDAHAGNLFCFGPEAPLTYFDPAFAGTHSPLLDVIKPLIHNSLLKWLYFPDEVAAENTIAWRVDDEAIAVDYDYSPSAIRMALFESRLHRVVAPTLDLLRSRDALPGNWQTVMQSAAMCCPLLTMNLADRERFGPEVALLGLAMAIELGGYGTDPVRPGFFERWLREVAAS